MTNIGVEFNFKDLSVDKLKEYCEQIKIKISESFDLICSVDDERTFSNTVQPKITMETFINPITNSFGYAYNFYPNKEIRDMGSKCEGEVENFIIESNMRKDVYYAFKEYEENNYKTEKKDLTDEEIRFMEHTMRNFRRNGIHLEEKDYEELKSMKKELSELCGKFKKNLNEENTSFNLKRKLIDGLPEYWFNNDKLVKKGKKKDGSDDIYRITLKYPDYIPSMKYIKNEQIRKKLYAAYSSRCAEKNVPIFEKTVKLRYKIAKKLGYNNHADFITELNIVKNAKTAFDFECNLNELFTPLYEKDMDELTKFAQEFKDNPLKKKKFDPWDISFYARAYKEQICNLDMDKIKNYFPLQVVRKGLFEIYQNLFGLIFIEIHTDNKWHDSVQLFCVNDSKTNETIGYFFLDMHPRDGKYSHAAAFDFQNGCDMSKINGYGRRPHIITMACNFPLNDCISFSDVVTFFHEFGHIMHQICSRPQLSMFTGFGVEWDFVEAPSQMLEFWCYCKEPLQIMSSHKDDGSTIPLDIIKKLKSMKKVLRASRNKRQLMFGLFDLKVHMMTFDDNEEINSQELWYDNEKDVMGFLSPEKYNPIASFGHLMGGYDACYYGYLRSETYATNMFYKWFKDGHVLDSQVGMRYRKKLLEPGSTKNGIDILTDFLGVEPDDSYFLIENCIDPSSL